MLLKGLVDEARNAVGGFRDPHDGEEAGNWRAKAVRMKKMLEAGDDRGAVMMAIGWLDPSQQEAWYALMEKEETDREQAAALQMVDDAWWSHGGDWSSSSGSGSQNTWSWS